MKSTTDQVAICSKHDMEYSLHRGCPKCPPPAVASKARPQVSKADERVARMMRDTFYESHSTDDGWEAVRGVWLVTLERFKGKLAQEGMRIEGGCL